MFLKRIALLFCLFLSTLTNSLCSLTFAILLSVLKSPSISMMKTSCSCINQSVNRIAVLSWIRESPKKSKVTASAKNSRVTSSGTVFSSWCWCCSITGGNDKQGFPMKQGVLCNHRVRLLLSDGMSCYRARRDVSFYFLLLIWRIQRVFNMCETVSIYFFKITKLLFSIPFLIFII